MIDLLVECLVRSLLFAGLAWVFLGILHRKSASVRHGIAVSALAAVLLTPFFHLVVPAQKLAWLGEDKHSIKSHVPKVMAASPITLRTWQEPKESQVDLLALALVGIWVLGGAVVVGRYIRGFSTVRRWAQQAEAIEVEGTSLPVLVSEEVTVPMTAWVGKNVIFIPVQWFNWADERRESAIRHEVAHIIRRDWLTQLLSQLACAVLWPNPLVWLLSRHARYLAERSADDIVLSSGAKPTSYAQDLLEFAREAKATLPGFAVSMAREVDVARRIEMVLKPRIERGAMSLNALALSAITLVALAIPVATWALVPRPSHPAPVLGSLVGENEPTQIFIGCDLIKPGVSLSSIGDYAVSRKAVKGMVAITTKQAEELSKRWAKGANLMSSPRVLTLADREATITISGNTASYQMQVTPTLESNGTIDLHVGYLETKTGLPDLAQEFSVAVKPGQSVVLLRADGNPKAQDILAVLTPKIINKIAP